MEKHIDFYHMVKEWTVSDYCTPGIKAEVILDMLISDFIGDLLQFHYNNGKKVTLLLKEYPIKIYEDEGNHRNAKVDYLVCVEDAKLVLVELKTTNDSFRDEQECRMQQAVGSGAKSLIDFYDKIVRLTGGNLSDRKKYAYSFRQFKAGLENDERRKLWDSVSAILKACMEKMEKTERTVQ